MNQEEMDVVRDALIRAFDGQRGDKGDEVWLSIGEWDIAVTIEPV